MRALGFIAGVIALYGGGLAVFMALRGADLPPMPLRVLVVGCGVGIAAIGCVFLYDAARS